MLIEQGLQAERQHDTYVAERVVPHIERLPQPLAEREASQRAQRFRTTRREHLVQETGARQPRGTRQCLDRGGGVGSNPGRHLANNQRRIGSDRGQHVARRLPDPIRRDRKCRLVTHFEPVGDKLVTFRAYPSACLDRRFATGLERGKLGSVTVGRESRDGGLYLGNARV